MRELKTYFANLYIIQNNAQNFHWNIVGDDFTQYHDFFGSIYDMFVVDVDDIAEKIRALGEYTDGRLVEILKFGTLEDQERYTDANEMLQCLKSNINDVVLQGKRIVKNAEEDQDYGMVDLVSKQIREYEKLLWKINSSIE